jgi:aromatic ring-cleaving dioxygenase
VIDPAKIYDWHAHIYYDAVSRPQAAQLRTWIEEKFTVRMGRWHDVPVGPHPRAMYQVAFAPDQFPTLVPFVAMNRMGLTVLLHPEAGRPRDDHTLHASWMGEILSLRTAMLPEVDRSA